MNEMVYVSSSVSNVEDPVKVLLLDGCDNGASAKLNSGRHLPFTCCIPRGHWHLQQDLHHLVSPARAYLIIFMSALIFQLPNMSFQICILRVFSSTAHNKHCSESVQNIITLVAGAVSQEVGAGDFLALSDYKGSAIIILPFRHHIPQAFSKSAARTASVQIPFH